MLIVGLSPQPAQLDTTARTVSNRPALLVNGRAAGTLRVQIALLENMEPRGGRARTSRDSTTTFIDATKIGMAAKIQVQVAVGWATKMTAAAMKLAATKMTIAA